ncbi:rRNA maturation RNase YbeY [Patescibacteria group bacterium]|nr:rRNA maturation RNase YbeY [Patescibacteria group bacterium]
MISILIKSAKKFTLEEDKIRSWASNSLKKNGLNNCELSLSFVDSKEIQALNRSYRKLDKATSVLTFFQGQATPEKTLILGDIVICPIEAKKKNLSIEFLIEHGIKNLLSEIPTAKSLRPGSG